MSERDANAYLIESAQLRIADAIRDPLEQTHMMTFGDRQYRRREARHMHETARGEGHARAMLNNPVYNAQETAAGMREPDERVNWPDFREHSNGALRREYMLTVHEIAQQDGFPGDDHA